MDIKEFITLVEIEGLEYFLRYKNTSWYDLENKKLLKQCHKMVKAANKIDAMIVKYNSRVIYSE